MQKTIELKDPEQAVVLFGSHDKHLRLLRHALGIHITARNSIIKLEGEEGQVNKAEEILQKLINIVDKYGVLGIKEVDEVITATEKGIEVLPEGPEVIIKGVSVRPRTEGQAKYVEAILNNDLVFCIGPAGTGKTYLAVAVALSALRTGQLRKIILARPAVEAGEKLGFLPGDIEAKVNPYLRPLYDALHDIMDATQVRKYVENDIIEILPLAFMRGRTLNDAFIILDEAQNCTIPQMKTFLTRLGVKAKVVVTGDITQVDLLPGEPSGLIDVQSRLKNINGIAFVYLTKKDIVRHRLVQEIVEAYGPKD
ncbi:MAG TPA: PhoH family protein [Candidatus Hypogeohydataceae bacterium YC41]